MSNKELSPEPNSMTQVTLGFVDVMYAEGIFTPNSASYLLKLTEVGVDPYSLYEARDRAIYLVSEIKKMESQAGV